MIKSALYASLGLLTLGSFVLADDQTCGDSQYDPTQYVCYEDNFLCPIVAGESLSYCSGACYSTFMYTCTNNVLTQLTPLASGTPFTLTASNPSYPTLDGKSVTACSLTWSIHGSTCSYCPDTVVDCPSGDTTVITAADASSGGSYGMDVDVPGGQRVYLGPNWNVQYTQAHSASIPAGSTQGGLVAYENGGLVNLNSGGWGWVACPPAQTEGTFSLRAVNSTNHDSLSVCIPVNLKVEVQPSGTVGAWQYS